MKIYWLSILFSVFLSSCKSYEVASQAKNPDVQTSGFEQVGVISLLESSEQAIKYEGQLMEALANQGIKANSSATHIAQIGSSREQVLAYLKTLKVDAILVTRQTVTSIKDDGMVMAIEHNDMQVKYDGAEVEAGMTNFYNTIYPSYQLISPTGSWKKKQEYRFEVTLYDAKSTQMIWQAFGPKVTGKQMEKAITVFSESISEQLVNHELVVSQRKQ